MMFTDRPDRAQWIDALALEASHPAFVTEIGNALSKWRFEPADSPMTPRREVIQFDFRRTGMVASVSHRDAASAVFVNTTTPTPAVRTVDWEQLEKTPARKVGVMPARVGDTPSGSAAVSFIIDQSATCPRSGPRRSERSSLWTSRHSKLSSQWQFEAPIARRGRPSTSGRRARSALAAAPTDTSMTEAAHAAAASDTPDIASDRARHRSAELRHHAAGFSRASTFEQTAQRVPQSADRHAVRVGRTSIICCSRMSRRRRTCSCSIMG